jgi:uncharacterized protein YndB with AHSA1/START domain
MSTTRITPDQDAIVSEIDIAAPPARVFQALTTASELQRWFTSPECPVKFWEMDPRAGGRYSYATEAGSIVVNGVREFQCHGEILEYDPPRVLVYTWIANWHDDVALRTVVRWELTPRNSDAQRPRHHARGPQRLQRRLARRSRNAEEVRRRINQRDPILTSRCLRR